MQHPLHIQHWMRMNKTKGRELTDAVMVYTIVYQLVWLKHVTYHNHTYTEYLGTQKKIQCLLQLQCY
jgi:hypothetical protein